MSSVTKIKFGHLRSVEVNSVNTETLMVICWLGWVGLNLTLQNNNSLGLHATVINIRNTVSLSIGTKCGQRDGELKFRRENMTISLPLQLIGEVLLSTLRFDYC